MTALFRKPVIFTLTLACMLGLGAARASACDTYCYKTVIVYEKVTCCEIRQVPYTCNVIRYDECGRPYSTTVTHYYDVKVRVTRLVPVKKVVKVYE